jgi:hypothetical protein
VTLRRTGPPLFLFVLCFSLVAASFGQTETATLTGLITDPQDRVLPDVEVEVTNVDTNENVHQTTNGVGLYVMVGVRPGRYRVSVTKEGFRRIDLMNLVLNVQEHLEQNFRLQVGSVLESTTVIGGAPTINTEDASVSTIVDQQFVENIPLNGRSFQSLILLTPGVTAVFGAATNVSGEFSVNGQRTETNYYMVDGVSANTGIVTLGYGAGATPAETALGTTQSLVSVDALQEFRINTSTYPAEYGRMPGGQISFQTRSGTNTWHGSLFDYLRNDALDSNNWFNDEAGLPKTAERQNDFGGTFGGPIEIPGLYNEKEKTFFFFSYEGLRLVVPQPAFTTEVPDAALRQNAQAAIEPLLDAFPLQNGAEQGNGLALYTATYSSPSSLDAYSIRLDHSFANKLTLFGRFADTPSHSWTRNVPGNFANPVNTTSNIKTLTIGATSEFSTRLINELRFNYTKNSNGALFTSDNFGGASPLTLSQAFAGVTPPEYYNLSASLLFGTNPYVLLFNLQNPQHQWNVTDSMSSTFGAHDLKYGIDYRRQVAILGANQLSDIFQYFSAGDVLSNAAPTAFAQTTPSTPPMGIFTNFSAFVQDEWNATKRLRLSLGVRWDLNPPPTGRPQPYTLNQITNIATAQLAPAGTPLWHTDYRGFAPRIGVAYQLSQNSGHETVIRGGFGVMYDVGNFFALYGLFGGVGILSFAEYSNSAFPFTAVQQMLPAPSAAPPYNSFVNAADPHLRLPYTLELNAAIEQGLGSNQTLTVSYVASGGCKLLHDLYLFPSDNPNFALGNGLLLMTNGGTSSYNSLQVEFQRRLSHGLQALVSYTWSHAIDDLSSNANLSAALLRGNADFDVRHNFSAAMIYEVQANYANSFAGAFLKHWAIDLRQTGRSGLPVDIYAGNTILPNGQYVYLRPDLVPGVPIYLSVPTAPGGRVVNINAFAPPAGVNGNEPRNFVRGFAAWQTDLAIHRDFTLHERLRLQFRAESFNVFNHPNFGSIDNFITDGPTLFGLANSTLNNSLGGLSPLYQMGGPRSLQLALRLFF